MYMLKLCEYDHPCMNTCTYKFVISNILFIQIYGIKWYMCVLCKYKKINQIPRKYHNSTRTQWQGAGIHEIGRWMAKILPGSSGDKWLNDIDGKELIRVKKNLRGGFV